MFEGLTWHNPPANWSLSGKRLVVETREKTDFWNRTHYGFTRKDGHFFHREVTGDFSCEVTLHSAFECLYDQLGLMVRGDDECWLKTGLEYSDGAAQMSTVLTRGFSDWSMCPVAASEVARGVSIRLTRHGEALRVQQRGADGEWKMVRLGYLDLPETCQLGLMCCSPERAGYVATFADFHILPAISRDLHA